MAKAKENLEVKELDFDSEGMFIQSPDEVKAAHTFSTGSLSLDILTGGVTPGIINLFAPYHVGKTTMLLIMAGEFQASHGYKDVRVIYHATEGRAPDKLMKMAPMLKEYSDSQKLNGKLAPIFYRTYPKSAEILYTWILQSLKQDTVKYFHIIDSCDGLKSEADAFKNMSNAQKTAAIAGLNTRFLREGSIYANQFGHVIAYTHQVRDKLSTGMSHVSGVGKQQSGGHAVSHYSNLRLEMVKPWSDTFIYENPSDSKSKIIGHYICGKIDKSSNSGNSQAKIKIPFVKNIGIDKSREIIDLSVAYGIVRKSGGWYSYNDKNFANGEVKFLAYLKDNQDFAVELENKIKEMAGL